MRARVFISLLIVMPVFYQLCEKDPTSSEDDGTLTDIDGNVYQVVKIGDQWWMAENLRVTHYRNGDEIPKVTDNSEWADLNSGAYCYYDNNDENADIYGSLYNWYAVNDNRNIAPEGWHVPSDNEWKQLEIYLGMSSQDADSSGFNRGTDEGNKLKSTSGWKNNGNGTDDYGFAALPCGNRDYPDGFMYGEEYYAKFWSSTAYDDNDAWFRHLYYLDMKIIRYIIPKQYGLSVRLVKD